MKLKSSDFFIVYIVCLGPSTKEKHCKFIPIDEELLAGG